MKLPRDLNGEDLASRLGKAGFEKLRQSGSHIVLKHVATGETISVPAHRPLKAGTLRALLRDVQELSGLTLEEVLKKIK